LSGHRYGFFCGELELEQGAIYGSVNRLKKQDNNAGKQDNNAEKTR